MRKINVDITLPSTSANITHEVWRQSIENFNNSEGMINKNTHVTIWKPRTQLEFITIDHEDIICRINSIRYIEGYKATLELEEIEGLKKFGIDMFSLIDEGNWILYPRGVIHKSQSVFIVTFDLKLNIVGGE